MEKLIEEFNIMVKQLQEKLQEIEEKAEDLQCELDRLQEKYDDYEEYVKDNYKPINPYEMYGVNERDFY